MSWPPSLLGLIIAAFTAAAVITVVGRRWRRAARALAVGVSLAVLAVVLTALGALGRGHAFTESIMWLPSLGVSAAFRLDGLSAVFALLISGIGAIVLAYAPVYLEWKRGAGRLLGLLVAFEASMLGLVLADDSITLFVFWELTSFTSFFLITFEGSEAARVRARQALLVTSGGGLVLLVGLLLLASTTAGDGGVSTTFSALGTRSLAGEPHYAAIVILIAIGAFTKSAQVPFHFWLPGAMIAPAPVSAYLHSATMVKAGVYVLARLSPNLGGTALWTGLLTTVGATTFVVGALLATVQRNVKLSLAYATVAALGALTLLLGLGTSYALGGAIVLLLAHGCYKAALFLTAGNLDHHRNERDPLAALGGTTSRGPRDMPVTAATAVLAAASMGGIPPLLGFIAKDAIFAATVQGVAALALTAAAVIAGAGLVTAAWLAGIAPYQRGRGPWHRTDVPRAMLIGPAVLALAGVVLGLAPDLVGGPLVAPALAAIAGRPQSYEVALWPGLAGVHGLAFTLGLASLTLGIAGSVLVYRHRQVISALRARLERLAGGRIHEMLLELVMGASARLSRRVQNGRLPHYIAAVVATTVIVTMLPSVFAANPIQMRDTSLREAPLLAIVGLAALAATLFRDRLSTVAALAALGLAVTFMFALFSGPDLAITQLAVETMMVILLVLVFRRLPPSVVRDRPRRRVINLVVAAAAGALVTLLVLRATSTTGFSPDAADGQIAASPEQGFRNVVNAILVSFRALDTLGEITVIALAGLGVAALAGTQPPWRRS